MRKHFLSLFLVLVTLDMGIKQYIEETFRKGEERGSADSKLILRRVHNKGFFLDTLDQYPTLIKSATVCMVSCIAAMDYRLFQKKRRWAEKLGMIFFSAGALSNTFDRLVRGYVVDYFSIRSKNSKLSKITANLADIYIAVGGCILLIVDVVKKKK